MKTQTGRRLTGRSLALITVLVGVVGFNALAFMQTWAMTHYSLSGVPTARPEDLSLLDKAKAVLLGAQVPRPANVRTPADVGLPYSTIMLPVSGTAQTLEGWLVGPDAATQGIVIMFAGYATSKDVLLDQAAALYSMGWSPMLVDFTGAGGSSGSDTTLGVREALDVSSSFEYARGRWPDARIVLYGVSMGAAAVLRAYAYHEVRPDALILESPFDSLLNTVRNRFDAIGLPAFPSAELMVFWGSVQHSYNGFDHSPIDYATYVRCPTLFMYGEADPRVTPAQSITIYNSLPPLNGNRLVAFPGAEHESLFAGNPDLWADEVSSFLSE